METITTIISLLSRYGMMFVKGTGVTLYMAFQMCIRDSLKTTRLIGWMCKRSDAFS